MSKYRKFETEELGSADILLHALQLYDQAGRIAHDQKDFDKLLIVGDRMLEASGQLIAISINQPVEGEQDVRLDRGQFGFSPGSAPEDIG